jgi:hypothetical protein
MGPFPLPEEDEPEHDGETSQHKPPSGEAEETGREEACDESETAEPRGPLCMKVVAWVEALEVDTELPAEGFEELRCVVPVDPEVIAQADVGPCVLWRTSTELDQERPHSLFQPRVRAGVRMSRDPIRRIRIRRTWLGRVSHAPNATSAFGEKRVRLQSAFP